MTAGLDIRPSSGRDGARTFRWTRRASRTGRGSPSPRSSATRAGRSTGSRRGRRRCRRHGAGPSPLGSGGRGRDAPRSRLRSTSSRSRCAQPPAGVRLDRRHCRRGTGRGRRGRDLEPRRPRARLGLAGDDRVLRSAARARRREDRGDELAIETGAPGLALLPGRDDFGRGMVVTFAPASLSDVGRTPPRSSSRTRSSRPPAARWVTHSRSPSAACRASSG